MMNLITKRLILLSISILLISACKKNDVHPNYELFKKAAGNYSIISAEVEGNSEVDLFKINNFVKESHIDIIINSTRIFNISWPEQVVDTTNLPNNPHVVNLLKPAFYLFEELNAENEFILKSSANNDKYVVQPKDIFLVNDNHIKCTLQKKMLINGVFKYFTIHATYKKSKNPPYDFFH